MRPFQRGARSLFLLSLLSLSCGHPRPAAVSPAAEPAPSPPALRLSGDVRPLRYDLDLTIIPSRTDFTGRARIEVEVARPTRVVWLTATALDIERATVGTAVARVIPGGDDFVGLALDAPLGAGRATIEVSYRGLIDREKSRGIYSETEGTDAYAYTLFEPLDARRAFPCFDQPDAKVPWKLTFHVERGHVALANAALEAESDEPSGLRKFVMAESKPLPSYLVAFMVGPFEIVDGGRAGRIDTPIRFVIPRGRAGELGYALEVTPKVVAALEDYFDMPYPYGKLDVAVVPRFWGTMEHPGLVAMGQPLTLIAAAEETRDRKQDYTNILAHELAHYWFGDLVTMQWWDDTWLNESLAQWLDVIITDRAEPSWRFLDRRPSRTAWAMDADEKLSTKAIRQPVESKEAIQASFDGSVTYEKGQAVTHMFESWVGADRWRDFIRAYVRAFAWKNATGEDFLGVMGSTLGPSIPPAFRTFLDRPGAPLVEHRVSCDGRPHLALTQRRALPMGTTESSSHTWAVPVCVRYGERGQTRSACSLLDSASGTLPLEGGCPSWVLMNAGGAGYYRSRYSRAELDALLAPGAVQTTAGERCILFDDVQAAVSRGELEIGDAMALVPTALTDPDERVQRAASKMVGALRADVLDDAADAQFRGWTRRTYGALARELGWRRSATDSDDRQELRASIVSRVAWAGEMTIDAEARRLAEAWLRDRGSLEDDMVDAVLEAAARNGDSLLFDRIRSAALGEADRTKQERLLTALGRFREPALVAQALELVRGPSVDLRESLNIVYAALYQRETRAQAWLFVQRHADEILARMRSDEASWFVGGVGGVFCDAEHREQVSALFAPRVSRIEGADYQLRQALDEIDRCVTTQARLVPDLRKRLAPRPSVQR